MDCVFCEIVSGDAPASFVYRDEDCAAFMDIMPVNPGHVLVVSNRHAADLSELGPEDGARIFEVAREVAASLYASDVKCDGVNFFLADGEVAGQEVFHVHLHVIPRFDGDGFGLTFGPEYGRVVERSGLDEAAEEIGRNL